MSTNFSSLRSNRQAALAKLNEEIKKEGTKQGSDDRFWKLTVDQKTKIGFARLRFLPAPQGEDVPWQRIFSHAFKMNGGWFIENCPTTLGQRPCPVCKDNSKLWNGENAERDGSQDVARERKRKLQYTSNILVIEDPAHPENNGKIFLFKYGKKIMDKIQELINPQFPDATPTNPFDLWEGADFKLKAQLKDNYQNYDKSEFAAPTTALGGKVGVELNKKDEAALEALWAKEYPLLPFIAEDQFKDYDTIEKRFVKVITGARDDSPRTAADAVKNEQPSPEDAANLAADIDARAEKAETKKSTRGKAKKDAKPAPADAVDAPPTEDEAKIKAFFGKVLVDDDGDSESAEDAE